MRKLIIICSAVSALILAVSSLALATSVALVPDTLNVTQGSTVTVSVNMSDSPGITMTAISAVILYDPDVFTYVDPSVAKGALLTHNWDLLGAQTTTLRVGGFDWDFGEYLAAGSGTLFTFTLKVNDDAPTGYSALIFDPYVGGLNPNSGFVYGDEGFVDIILLDSEMTGASINVIPEPATIALLGFGALSLIRRKR